MDIVTIDLETFYSQEYSLSKMPTDAYVHDRRFEVIGLGIKINNGETDWYSGDNWVKFLQGYDFSNTAILGWNTVFDAYILHHKAGLRPKVWLDGMSMFRGIWGPEISASLANAAKWYRLGEKGTEVIAAMGKRRRDFTPTELHQYGDYCINDVELTWQLWKKMAPAFPPLELKLIDLTLRMFIEPELLLDKPGLENYLTQVQGRKQVLLDMVKGNTLPDDASEDTKVMWTAMRLAFPQGLTKKDLMSNPKFADALRALGVEPPIKLSPTTGKPTLAFAKTDQEFLALQEHENPAVQALVAARLGTKSTIEETRLQGLIESADRGPVPIGLNYAGAKTKRWSGGAAGTKTNFQNMPGNSQIKDFIYAPEGMTILGADLSNIELRVGLWLAGEMDKLDALGRGLDLYKDFASKVFDVAYEDVDTEQRFIGKTSCIAEGQLVLTPRGLVPIQDVMLDDKVWDGVEWVSHDGVIYQGVKDVYTYQGLTATPDHKVYLADGSTCEFGEAAHSRARIARTGDGRRPVPLMAGGLDGAAPERAPHITTGPLPVWADRVAGQRQPPSGQVATVPHLRDDGTTSAGGAFTGDLLPEAGAAEAGQCHAATLREPQRRQLPQLRRARYSLRVRLRQAVRGVCAAALGVASRLLPGPRGQQWALRTGQLALGHAGATDGQPPQHLYGQLAGSGGPIGPVGSQPLQPHASVQVCETGANRRGDYTAGMAVGAGEAQGVASYQGKVRVYDLLNAGPRHRFTVSGVLVSNCLSLVYGVGAAKLQQALIIGAKNFLGLDLDISLDECKRIVAIYRAEHKGVVSCWEQGKDALWSMHADAPAAMFHKGLAKVEGRQGIRLPSGLHLRYHNLRQEEKDGQRNWVCDARRGTDKLYGAKVFQQFTQATARCVLAERIPIIHRRYPVKLTIHDANYCLAPEEEAGRGLAWVLKQMTVAPQWMPGIPLDAEGGYGRTLKDCGKAILKTENGKLIHVPTKKVISR